MTTLHARGAQVQEFHVKNGFSNGDPWPTSPLETELYNELMRLSESMAHYSKRLLQYAKQHGDRATPQGRMAMRAHLVAEEVGELFDAMARCDEVEALDAVCDSEYVLDGMAVSYGWPLQEAFNEVQRSNMSKQAMPTDPDRARLRDKGPNYSPPDIRGVLAKYRGEVGAPLQAAGTITGRMTCADPKLDQHDVEA